MNIKQLSRGMVGWVVLAASISFESGCNGAYDEAARESVATSQSELNAAPKSSDFVLEAENSIRLGSSSTINSGDVGARGKVSGATLSGSAVLDVGSSAKTPTTGSLIADSIRLGASSTTGDLQTNTLQGSGAKRGTLTGVVALPALPSVAAVTAGTSNLSVAASKTLTAAPGRYATVSVGASGVLKLPAGTYELRDLTIGASARLEVTGSVQLRITNQLSIGASAFLGAASGTNLKAGALRIEVSGKNGSSGELAATPKSVTVGNSAQLAALLLAPNGTLSVGSSVTLAGAFMARDIDLGSSAKVTYQDGFAVTCNVAQCDDRNPCTVDSCSPGTGGCVNTAGPSGSACDDGNANTTGDQCSAGTCRGTCAPGFGGASCTDIDECAASPRVCAIQAQCTNTVGSYRCTCSAGYVADGASCRTQVSATVSPSQGGTVSVTDPQSPLVGTHVELPPQTSGTPVSVVISEPARTRLAVPAQALSPVVHLEPEGVVFSPPARLTLPYDPARMHSSSPSAISVLRLAAGASRWSEVAPVAVDIVAGTATVLTSGFSDWVVIEEGQGSMPSCVDTACRSASLAFDGSTWTCSYGNQADGTACDDGNGCTAGDACVQGACAAQAGCASSASCVGSGAGASCVCQTGFVGNGYACADVDECATLQGTCAAHATCVNTPGAYHCDCQAGYRRDGAACVLDTHFSVVGMLPSNGEEVVFRVNGDGTAERIAALGNVEVHSFGLTTPDGLTLYALGAGADLVQRIYTMDLTSGRATSVALRVQRANPNADAIAVLDGKVLARHVVNDTQYLSVLIDPATGDEVVYAGGQGRGTFDPATQLFYAFENDVLVTIDRNGTIVRSVAAPGLSRARAYGPMPTGEIIALNALDGTVVTVDPVTGVNTPRGSLCGATSSDGLASYDVRSNTLYTHVQTSGGNQLCTQPLDGSERVAQRLPDYAVNLSLSRSTVSCSGQCVSPTPTPAAPCSVPSVCDRFATCTVTGASSHACTCNAGTTGDGQFCQLNDACGPTRGGCDPLAACATVAPFTASCSCGQFASGDGFSCQCNQGFELRSDGRGCVAINSCRTGNGGCGPHATCQSTGPGSNSCLCPSHASYDGTDCMCEFGYRLQGSSCVGINACTATPNGGCDSRATCTATAPGYRSCACRPPFVGDGETCGCPTGYQPNSRGTCDPIQACAIEDNGGCNELAVCTNTGPGTRSCACKPGYEGDGFTCTLACPGGYQRVAGECTPVSGYGLYAALTGASSVQMLSIAPAQGTSTSLGTLGNLASWNGVMQLDYAGSTAYAVGNTAAGQNLTYVFATSGQTSSYASQVSGRLREVIGTFFDGRIVGGWQNLPPDWQMYIDNPATRQRGNSARLPGVGSATSTAFAFDPGRERVFAIAKDANSPQRRLVALDMSTLETRTVQVAYDYRLGAVNAAGNLVVVRQQGASWVIGELDTRTGVGTDFGPLGDLTEFDGVLSVDHVQNRAYAHGRNAAGVYRFYTFDMLSHAVTSVDDTTDDPAHLVLVRATGSCLGAGCGVEDSDVDPCALGTAACSQFASCSYNGPGDAVCECNDGYEGDGYLCVALEE